MTKKKTIILVVSLLLALILVASAVGITYYCAVKLPEIRKKEKQLEEYRAFYAEQLVKFDNENKTFNDFEVDVAFLGDSLTAGYNVQTHYPEYVVTNRGIGGETAHGLLARLDVSVLDLQPKVCVMCIGGNNMDTMFEDYEDILLLFKQKMPNTKVVLVSHAPTGDPIADRNKTFTYNNVKVKLLAQKYGYEFVDIYTPMFDLSTGKMKAEYTVDGAHFTAAGYEVVTNAIKPVVDELLK